MKKYSEEQQELIEGLQVFAESNGVPKSADFNSKNGLRCCKYYKDSFNVKSLKDVLSICNIQVSEEYRRMHYSDRKGITDEELLDILYQYSVDNGFPVYRDFNASNGLPNGRVYYERFGSFENALKLAKVDIPQEREWLFNRVELSDDEIKEAIRCVVLERVEENKPLPTYVEIDADKSLPSTAVISRRFGSLIELYNLLGYGKEYDDSLIREKLKLDYKRLAKKIGGVPTSRDLDKYSLIGESSSASMYLYHFGSIHEMQTNWGYETISLSRGKSDEELLNDLLELSKALGRVPQQKDISRENGVASYTTYAFRFGSVVNSLKLAGFSDDEIGHKRYITDGGVVCLSLYEYKFASLMEKHNIQYSKEALYSDYIESFERRYRFDFIVNYNGNRYFIEVFGIDGNDNYDIRTSEKIQLCKDNNIPLISFYSDIFWEVDEDGLLDYFKDKVNELDKIYYI